MISGTMWCTEYFVLGEESLFNCDVLTFPPFWYVPACVRARARKCAFPSLWNLKLFCLVECSGVLGKRDVLSNATED